MKEYEGTLIFATHDRRLVQTVATRILTFEQGDIKLFDGPYRHYTERHSRKNGDEDKEKRRLLVENQTDGSAEPAKPRSVRRLGTGV